MNNINNMDAVQRTDIVVANSFMSRVYGWMSGGLLISGAVAYYVSITPALIDAIIMNRGLFYGLLIAEFLIVIGMSGFIAKMSSSVATGAFVLYALMNGLTLSVIFLVFTKQSIVTVFATTAIMFGSMSAYGYITKKDLSSWGPILIFGLWGIIIASLINLFLKNDTMSYVVSWVGVAVFTGLTAYDTQKIKALNVSGRVDTDEHEKAAIVGALILYLDFINLFLSLLNIMGKRR